MSSAAPRSASPATPLARRFKFLDRRLAALGRSMCALTSLGVVLGGAGCDVERHEPVRRVVLISCDTLRADHLGMYGYARDASPKLDAFAKNAVVFERAYGTAPHTNPALSSLLTGRLPDELGVSGGNRMLMPEAVRSLPEMLRDAGIPSAAIVSNWALRRPSNVRQEIGVAQGFTDFDDEMGTDSGLREGHFERLADATTDAAIAWLDANEKQHDRFFLWVHYQDPHGPYTPPDDYRGRFESELQAGLLPRLGSTQEGFGQIPHYQIIEGKRQPSFYLDRYDEEIRFFDHEVGRLLDSLQARGLFEDSLIVFTSDHGESLGEHNYWFTHESNLYDEQVRVPLVVRYPDNLPRPSGDNLVGHLDFVPSVLDALGLPPEPTRGVSLISESLPGDRVLSHSLHPPDDPRRWFGITDARYRLLIPRTGPELYDLRDDSKELRNIAHDQPERVKSMIARYERWMSELAMLRPHQGVELTLDDASRSALEALGYLPPEDDASPLEERGGENR